MTEDRSPSVRTYKLHAISNHEARASTDGLFPGSLEWRSLLMKHQLTSDPQVDWKAEPSPPCYILPLTCYRTRARQRT